MTAEESGTYNDFTNINLAGLKRDGSDGVNEVSYLLLEVLDEMQLLQPQANVQVSHKTPERFLKAACRVIRKGSGYPSVFNTDEVIMEQLRIGKTLEDAREGGTSGCIETGSFGKEAFILTGYLNVPKILEVTLNNGSDPLTGRTVGLQTGDPRNFESFDALYGAFEKQLNYFVDLKIRVNNYIEQMYACYAPAPFLSVLIRDCIAKGKDYNNGGPRYNANYIQCCGIGTITDSLSAIKKHSFEEKAVAMDRLLNALQKNFDGEESLRLMLFNKTPFYGNDDDLADSIMQQVYASLSMPSTASLTPRGRNTISICYQPPAMFISAGCWGLRPMAGLQDFPSPTVPRLHTGQIARAPRLSLSPWGKWIKSNQEEPC